MDQIKIQTQGDTDVVDITKQVQNILTKSGKKSGIINLFLIGSTAGISVVEHEPNLTIDIKEFFNKIIPKGDYHHHKTWHDDNGHSHIRATLLKPDLTLQFENNELILGTWQQIVVVDFDTHPRERDIAVKIIEG